MNIGIILSLAAIIILIAIIKNFLQGQNHNENESMLGEQTEAEENVNEQMDLKELFFKEVRNGEKPYRFMSIHNQFDLMFIKSLFQSEEIPYYIENEHVSRLRPGMQIGSFRNVDFQILERDYELALRIVKDYKKNKRKNHKEKQTVRRPFEVLFGNWAVPEANVIDGIEINYRTNHF